MGDSGARQSSAAPHLAARLHLSKTLNEFTPINGIVNELLKGRGLWMYF